MMLSTHRWSSSKGEDDLPSPFPNCTMCIDKSVSKSLCQNCERYLCERCDSAHKEMICFKTHSVLPLEFSNGTKEENAEFDKMPFSQEHQHVDRLVDLSGDLETILKNVEEQRKVSIEQINETWKRYEDFLTKQKNEVIESLDDYYYVIKEFVKGRKDLIEEEIKIFVNTEESSDDCDSGTASGIDLNHLNQIDSEKTAISLPLTFSFDQNNQNVESKPNLSTTSDPDPLITNHVNSMQLFKTFGQKGNDTGSFNTPHGLCLGFNEDIVVADSSNHRIQVFSKTGTFIKQFGNPGRHDGHLWHPRKIACLPTQQRYVICDRGYERSRMQLFSKEGKYCRRINIQFIDIVAGITVTDNEDIVVVDSVTPTIFILGTNEFLRSIDCSEFIIEPSDIAFKENKFYICDFKGHSIVVVDQDGNFLRRFGTKITTNFPNGIAISPTGDVLVGDSHGNFFHITVFNKNGNFICEYRCPYIKVSRCCCLEITEQGRLVTVDKTYHRILIVDSLYAAREPY